MIDRTALDSRAIRLSVKEGDKEIGRAFIYLVANDLNEQPYGLLEDVFIEEEYRGKGHGKQLIAEALVVAKEENCYKVIATSRYARPKVHTLYQDFGFADHGKEFRIDFK